MKENENCRFLTGDVKFTWRFYAGIKKQPNYCTSILKVFRGILKENTCNLPELFCWFFFTWDILNVYLLYLNFYFWCSSFYHEVGTYLFQQYFIQTLRNLNLSTSNHFDGYTIQPSTNLIQLHFSVLFNH